ncbi:hypothetical protein SDRG_03557 [Saprolegnia diclina VS20]|uniref:RING-type E3 ubiquitin transferase n=1 Tax=Saprolegnia diclina (strain VS20) TaxID=1156394 RepID=T0S2U1_SAPDV|nr:hypothetical protein SDRG_03557 [Saprolegnia diclina VS20]EQC39353.1 hypothetical protein SDRG_03557 [Saprolegnia diclina VS20]|eukprot:XP_008607414.1 hypothetical protein SDRG_03557 [Saprolegnia diclina VS20]
MGVSGSIVRHNHGSAGRHGNNPPPLYGDPTSGNPSAPPVMYTQAQMQALYMSRGRADMGFLQSQMGAAFQAAPEMQETTTVRNDVNLKKQSVALTTLATGECVLEFLFDSAKPCSILLYFNALETIDDDGNSSFLKKKPELNPNPDPLPVYPAALGQSFATPPFDLAAWPILETTHQANTTTFPLIVEIQVHVDGPSPPQKQSTFLSFPKVTRGDDTTFKAHILKQKVQVQGQTYELQEIYGMDGSIAAAPKSPTDGDAEAKAAATDDVLEGAECIICLCEPRNTTILPCRHMCICLECSEALKKPGSTCPICRTKVESLLQIRVT